MGSAYDAWIQHRLKCEKCAAWHNAEPEAERCRTGRKMYDRMIEDA